MGQIECFWLEPTKQYKRYLRRYSSRYDSSGEPLPESRCPLQPGKFSYHNASNYMDVIEADDCPVSGDLWDHADPLWAKTCGCGYVFMDDDQWQLFVDPLYRKATGELMSLREAPPGAMWDASWLREWHTDWVGPDGLCVVVKTPGGEWPIDGPSSNGDGWNRTGKIPKITATPSILISDRYHGWLRDGMLIEC